MVVYVAVDRQRPPFGERRQEALDLSSHLHSKLSAQPHSVSTCKSVCPESSEPSTESAAAVDQQIKLARGRKGPPFEQIQMQADREVGTTAECGDSMFPAGAVDDDAGAAEPPAVIAGHDPIRYALGQTAVVGMKNRNKPRWIADRRWSNGGHGQLGCEFRLAADLSGEPGAPHLPNYDNQPATDQAVGPQRIRMANYNRRTRC